MLVGIVKKNAIMRIDCAQVREEVRHRAPAEAITRLHHARSTAHHDDDHGGDAGRFADGDRMGLRKTSAPSVVWTVVGGLILAHM